MKKGIIAMVMPILVPIIVVVLIVSIFFAILEAIIGIIKDILIKTIETVMEFLAHPIKSTIKGIYNLSNLLQSWTNRRI